MYLGKISLKVPKPAPASVWSAGDEGAPFTITLSQATPLLMITAEGAERIRFFPARESAATPKIVEEGERLGERLTLGVEDHDEYGRVSGVVEIVRQGGSEFYTLAARDGGPAAEEE